MKPCNSNQALFLRLRKKVVILLLLISLPTEIVHASYGYLSNNLRNYTLQDGLSDNMILCIHKDRKGFMWFGTSNGLSKYDGKNFCNYTVRDGFNISVSKIKENSEGLLFLLSNDWITLLDSKKELVQPLSIKEEGRTCQFLDFTLINDSVLIACDRNAFLKISVLQRRDNPSGQITGVYRFPLQKNEYFTHICPIPNQKEYYAATNYGRVLLIDVKKMKIIKETQLSVNAKSTGISSIQMYNERLWVTSMLHGIFIFDKSLKCVKHFINDSIHVELSHNDVYSVNYLSEGWYLAATWFGYTMIHQESNKEDQYTSSIYQQISSDINRNLENRMISSYYDPAGIMWIGTHGGGIIMADLRWNFYKRYEQDCDNETESIITDNKGRIYLSTYHLGIMRSTVPFHTPDANLTFEPISIPEVSTTYLCSVKDHEGILWFGNKDGKIISYNSIHENYKVYDALSRYNVSIHTLFIDRNSRFWVGTSNGLFLLDKDYMVKRHIQLENQYPNVLDIKEDKEKNLWIATGIGVFRLKEVKTNWEVTKCQQTQPVNTAQCILVASDGNVYVGFKNGLGIIQNKSVLFSKFLTTENGLMSNWINCITEGTEGDIWIGSNSGVTRYAPKSICYNYYISGSNKCVKKIKNTLFWGGSKHIVYFKPEKAILSFEANYNNKVLITNLEIGGKRVVTGEAYNDQIILQQQIAYTDDIELNYKNRDFSLAFSNCSYSYGMQKYEYRLYPYQKEWIICNDGEGVSYANLLAGEYTFQVRAIYPGKNNSETTALKIIISPHWSQTWVFRMALLLLVVCIIWYLLLRMKKRQRRREQILSLEHDLSIANMQREQEATMGKERELFFVQVAHELRTPLTLILAPLSELLLLTDLKDAAYTKLQYIRKSAKSMQYLINELLVVQKIKAGMVKLSVCPVSIREVVESSSFSFKEFSISQGIYFKVAIEYDVDLFIDTEKIESAIKNLLSNAFKYTPSGGEVSLRVFNARIDDQQYCCVQVKDTGAGISVEQQTHIFDSFTVGNNTPNHSTAIGIGLYVVKSTIELHHGFVRLESQVENGSSFTLYIPEGKEHFTEDNINIQASTSQIKEESLIESIPSKVSPLPVDTKLKMYSVLIVEDNTDVRNYTASLFHDKYCVYEACNGEEGIQKAKRFLPDLIISDVMMPVKDGFELCKELKNNQSLLHIPIIMLTAKAEDTDLIKATHIGIDDYLIKPFNAEVLKAKVENLLAQRKILKSFYSKSLNLKLSDNTHETSGEELFMQQVISVIEANLTSNTFNAKTLSSLLNISQPTLYRKIKNICQLSIIEVIRNVRISKAASLLLLKKYSVLEVCEMVGYNDYDTFRKHFVAQFKVSPSKYENIAKEEK